MRHATDMHPSDSDSGPAVRAGATDTSTAPQGTSKASPWAAATLVAMVVAVYAPVWRAGFVIDDVRNLPANPALRSAEGLRRIWFAPGAVQQYYPLVYTTYWLECRVWGFHPFGYHLVNVLLHAANAVLVWRLAARLGLPGSWLAAALFAVHPVEVDTVAWISERKNLLSLFYALASLLAYLRFAPIEPRADETARRRTAPLCASARFVRRRIA